MKDKCTNHGKVATRLHYITFVCIKMHTIPIYDHDTNLGNSLISIDSLLISTLIFYHVLFLHLIRTLLLQFDTLRHP